MCMGKTTTSLTRATSMPYTPYARTHACMHALTHIRDDATIQRVPLFLVISLFKIAVARRVDGPSAIFVHTLP